MNWNAWRIAPAVGVLAMLAGCGLPGAPQPPSLELPKPVHDLRVERRGNRVTLTWSVPRDTTDRQRVRRAGAMRICRSIEELWTPASPSAQATCSALAEVAPPGIPAGSQPRQASFVDTLPESLSSEHPMGATVYAVEALNPQGHSAGPSNAVRVPLAPTLPPPEKLVFQLTADGPVISWVVPPDQLDRVLQPEPARQRAPLAYRYRVYRREKDRPRAGTVVIATEDAFASPTLPQPNENVRDTTAEWEHAYEYRVAVVTTVNSAAGAVEVEGEESPPVELLVHDTFPPRVPTGVQAVFTEAGAQRFVDVTWLAATESDTAGYNVYRREEGSEAVKLTAAPVKTPTFRDAGVASGRRYYYSISALDTHGNESARSAEASERVPEKQ